MKDPKEPILVTRSSMPPLEEFIEEIRPIWDSHWLTNMGVYHERFKEQLNQFLGVPHTELFVNGHMALEMAIQAMGLTGEVITTPFTFVSTTHAIVRNGLTPVFCDINPEDFTIDVSKLEALITDRTSAIIPVHVYGNLCDVDTIDAIAKKHGLKVFYDAAHAFGERYHGKGVGTFGDASMFSFHATKVFHSIEGGAVCYHDEALGKELYKLKNFGILSEEVIDGVGANAKMNEFQAAMGICNLRHLDEEIAKRKQVFQHYMSRLQGVKGLRLPAHKPGLESNYAYFPVIFEEEVFGESRDQVYDRLRSCGIIARKYFYPLTNACDCYKGRFSPERTPTALKISMQVLTLPLYADLSLTDVDRICQIVLEQKSEKVRLT